MLNIGFADDSSEWHWVSSLQVNWDHQGPLLSGSTTIDAPQERPNLIRSSLPRIGCSV
jgi:hypothetical protein